VPLFHHHELEDARAAANHDLAALAGEVTELSDAVAGPAANARARDEYELVEGCFAAAEQAYDSIHEPEDVQRVTAAVEEGRFHAACAVAHLERRSVPVHNQPCFFDPAHGLGAQNIAWTPPNGDPRTVPVCAACASLVIQDVQPEPRRFVVGEHVVDWWEAPDWALWWAGGHFAPAGGCRLRDMLAGLPLGAHLPDGPDDDGVITGEEIWGSGPRTIDRD
jgi:hypothetical protein